MMRWLALSLGFLNSNAPGEWGCVEDLSQFGYRLALCGKVGKHYCSTKKIDILETLSFMICGSGCLSNPTNLKTSPEPLITFS